MNKLIPPLILMIVMMMAPQILETLYSPGLTAISQDYGVTPETASQTLSVYFIAFAIGVVFWGRISDRIGRRLAMLGGLSVYLVGTLVALVSVSFGWLLVARVMVAFGIAVGSVITQTILRDCYQGASLGKVFATMGIALSISPVIGMLSGGTLVYWGGSQAIFIGQFLLALGLLAWCYGGLVETLDQASSVQPTPLFRVLGQLLTDGHIWLSAWLVASFNVMIFSYFSLAPFIFKGLGFSSQAFGYTGIVMALGSLIGAMFNKKLLSMGIKPLSQILIAMVIALCSSFMLFVFQGSLLFLLPSGLLMVAFGLAIPNILSQALVNYSHHIGTAGALLGLIYYLLIGMGLVVAGLGQHFPFTILVCSLVGLVCCFLMYSRQ